MVLGKLHWRRPIRAGTAVTLNPDEAARATMAASPELGQRDANAFTWQEGRRRLEAAIAEGSAFTFETTLGGETITRLQIEAATEGAVLRIWFAGLDRPSSTCGASRRA